MAPTDVMDGTGTALVPSEERPPTFTSDDLALIDTSDGAGGLLESARSAVAAGVFTAEEAVKHYGLTPSEATALAQPRARPATGLAAIEKELAEIRALRTTDRKKYWSKAVQEREAELYAARELANGAPARGAAAEQNSAKVDALNSLPLALRQEWSRSPDGVEGAIRAIRGRAILAYGDMDDAETAALEASFDDQLDDESQEEIGRMLATDSGRWPKATQSELDEFAKDTTYGAGLLSEWGSAGPVMLGRAKREAETLLSRLSPVARRRTEYWAYTRSPREKAALIRGLATRAQRRL